MPRKQGRRRWRWLTPRAFSVLQLTLSLLSMNETICLINAERNRESMSQSGLSTNESDTKQALSSPGSSMAAATIGEKIPNNIRMLRILEVLAAAGSALSATEINAAIGLPKPTIHRLCQTLEREGFLVRAPGSQRYETAPRLLRIAAGVLNSNRLRIARHRALAKLSETIGETCNIALPSESGMLYLDRVETQWPLRVQLPTGSTVPFHCTASGKLYLSSLEPMQCKRLLDSLLLPPATRHSVTKRPALEAELERIRRQGYSVDKEEFVEGMVAIAVPILDARGSFTATLSFHAPTQRMSAEQALTHLDALKRTAVDLAETFGETAEGA